MLAPLHRAARSSGVFTDGSCEGNPGPGGWGVVWVEDDAIVAQKRSAAIPPPRTTAWSSPALIEALPRCCPSDAAVTVYSDSKLCVKTVNEWAAGWERARLAAQDRPDREPRAGAGALGARASATRTSTLRWIRAHDGSRWNEYADALAESWLR